MATDISDIDRNVLAVVAQNNGLKQDEILQDPGFTFLPQDRDLFRRVIGSLQNLRDRGLIRQEQDLRFFVTNKGLKIIEEL